MKWAGAIPGGSSIWRPPTQGGLRPPVKHGPYPWRLHALTALAWAGCLLASQYVDASPVVRRFALGLHVVALIAALGAVVLMDWYALVWLSGRRRFRELIRLTEAAHPLIWLGSTLLLLTGIFLGPDLSIPLTIVKMTFVLILLNNGIAVWALGRRLGDLIDPRSLGEIPGKLRLTTVALLSMSQLTWWGAVVIGLITTMGRHGP